MDRGIRKVRKSIKQRKKNREIKNHLTTQMLPIIASEEEKHGIEPSLYDFNYTYDKKQVRPLHKSAMFVKAIASLLLFFAAAFLLQTNMLVFEQPKKWINDALQEEFPFAKVNDWYVTTFGTPLAITPQGNIHLENDAMVLPVSGEVVETFSANGSGIMISPKEKSVVSAMNRGVVIFAGNDKYTNKTIIIQHADNSETTYGFLSSIDVHPYQVVEANETIATFQPTLENKQFYFSIEKDNQFIDPSQVIPVEDIP